MRLLQFQPKPLEHTWCPRNGACREKMPSDDIPRRMLVLLLELLKSAELPALAVGGAWDCINLLCMRGSAALGSVALELDVCGVAVAQMQAIESRGDWVVSPVLRNAYLTCSLRLGASVRRLRWRR